MRDSIEHLLRSANATDPERAERLWVEYRADGPDANAAFATLLAWHGGAVYRRVWGFVRSDTAEDVFQEVLILLHRHRGRLTTLADALRWVRATADRRALDALRREVRRSRREARGARPELTTADHATRERVELQQALAAALVKLTEEQRQAVALHYFEGLDKQTAARVLGVNRDTLAKRLNEALAQLRHWLPVPVTLAVAVPMLSAERLSDIAARACVASAGFGKPLAVLLTLAVCGVAVGGWTALRSTAPAPQTAARTVESESVPDRNLRVFRTEVLPRQLAALKALVPDGEVELASAEAFDSRIEAVYRLRHTSGGPPWRLRFLRGAAYPTVWVFTDFADAGRYRPIDVTKPIILWRNPVTKAEVVVRPRPFEAAVAAFAGFPDDDRTREAVDDYHRRLAAAFRRYEGDWYQRGDPSRRGEVRFENGQPVVRWPDGVVVSDLWRFRVTPDGRPALSYAFADQEMEFSADGRRVIFHGSGDWWSRAPSR
jgi:RNA polymerase sigma-70 factor (ECF subfamily)